jgi:hypothetical protein
VVQTAGLGARQVVEALQASRNEVEQTRVKVQQQEFEAKQAKKQGTAGLIGGLFKAGESILGAASTISSNAIKYKLGG